jgi:uncharacterized oxidoreductase
MQMTGNTILITGGGSGIGRALAEAYHRRDNTVVIAGRREDVLSEVAAENPGMQFLTLDISDARGVQSFAKEAIRRFPNLNVLINNAGIMKAEDIASASDHLAIAEETVAINLLGPIRLTAALLPHLQRRERSAILTVSSGLAFVPMAITPTYSATKAAIHSYSLSLRHQLKNAGTQVIEIIPPYVQTHLMGAHQASDPNAMPLADFIDEVMRSLETHPSASEVVVERCNPFYLAAQTGKMDAMFEAINSHPH